MLHNPYKIVRIFEEDKANYSGVSLFDMFLNMGEGDKVIDKFSYTLN